MNPCDPDRIEALLSDQLDEATERALTVHLDSCEHCQHQLQAGSADPAAWADASRLLPVEPFDDESLLVSLEDPPSELRKSPSLQHVIDSLSPTDDPAMLGRIAHYEVSAVIGAGGMGVVLKGFDRSLDRPVAIKVMAPHLAASGAARQRFAREAKAAAAVLHPNVVAIHGVSDGNQAATLPYLVMSYVRGSSLQQRIDKTGPLSIADTLRIASQVVEGLAAAHAQGLVHRDIKPGNILLEDGIERVSITDFGLARTVDDATVTHSGVIAGTPQYMSPEQARGDSIDARSDLFSLGSVVYAMCTGRSPFRAENPVAVLRRICDEAPRQLCEVRPEYPRWLSRFVGKLLAKDRRDRYQSAADVADVLRQCIAHLQSADTPLPPELCDIPRWHRSRWFAVAISVCVFIGLGLAGWYAFIGNANSAPAAAEPTIQPTAEV